MTRSFPVIIVGCICALALAFGLVRIGVSLLLTLQSIGAFDLPTFAEPVAEVEQFLAIQNNHALIPLNPLSYFSVIAMMGFCLVFGAVLSWRQSRLGYGVLSVYLLAHAGLFVNFQTINPKINFLIAGVILLIILVLSNQRRRSVNTEGVLS